MKDEQSRIISKVLSPAVGLWLRSQVEAAERLQFQVHGGDRQILSGHIPKVTIAACGVVYQGIALSQINAIGEGIRVNLRDVLRGRPLRLLETVPVQAEAKITETDLNTSLQTPMLADALTALLFTWLESDWLKSDIASGNGDDLPAPGVVIPASIMPIVSTPILSGPVETDLCNPDLLDQQVLSQHPTAQSTKLHQLQVSLKPDQLIWSGILVSSQGQSTPFALCTGLRVVEGTKLQLDRPQWLTHPQAEQGQFLPHLQGFEIDLGSDVNLQQLILAEGELICSGSINVLP